MEYIRRIWSEIKEEKIWFVILMCTELVSLFFLWLSGIEQFKVLAGLETSCFVIIFLYAVIWNVRKEQKKKEEEKPKYVINASSDEIYLMAACVMMESGSYSYDGQLAVASVIVNRVKSGRWGSSITDVIYADGQFPGATSGLLDKYLAKGPSSEALKATKAALSGSNNIGDYLFFNSAKRADYSNYSSYTVVGGNCFYKK